MWDVHFILPWKGNERVLWELTNGGYIVGFILAAGLIGFLAERGWDRKPWLLFGMLLANAAVYLVGLAWLYYLIATDWSPPGATATLGDLITRGFSSVLTPESSDLSVALWGGLYPFIVGDLMKLLLAARVLPGAWLLVEKLRGERHLS
jgi:biotin transport system substrate-specific component